MLLPAAAAIDGQSNQASDEETDRVWNDPNCDRTRNAEQGIDWSDVRAVLHETPFPQSVPVLGAVMKRLERISDLDREVQVCPFGVVAVFFFFIKYLVETPEPQLEAAKTYFSLLDNFASGMHPALIDRSDWLVKDARIVSLRRVLLRKFREAEDLVPRWPRVYVYDPKIPEVQEMSQGASFCGKGQWGMEVHLHEWLMASPHLTPDPAEADFFFVPAYSICMFEGGFFKMDELDAKYKSLVRALPYFSRNGGRDHIFTFGSGMSANVFRSWREEIPSSIFLTPETWLFNDFPSIVEPCFNTWKDIAIPGYLHRHEVLSLAGQAKPFAKREHLAVFLGRIDPSRASHPATGGPDVRAALRQLHTAGQIFVGQNLSIPDMHGVMGNSKFCFVPKGKSAWSLRFYEALFANCVPIVLSDFWELPFEDFLDVSSFVVKWPMELVGQDLITFLTSIPDEVVEEYMANARRLRCWYVYPGVLTEVDVPPSADGLYQVCPHLREENAYAGMMRLLERKHLVAGALPSYFERADA